MADLKVSELPVITSATDDDLIIINDGNITTSSVTWANVKSSIDVLSGQINFNAPGTELQPTIILSGDTNSGIYSPGADQLAFATNGNTAIYIDDLGRIGVGNESPGSFDASANGMVLGSVVGSDFGITIASGNSSNSSIYFADGTAAGSRDAGKISYVHSDDALTLSVSADEKVRITSEGNLGIGTTDPDDLIHISAGNSGVSTGVPNVQGVIVEADNTTNAAVQFHTANTQTAGVYFGDPQNADASHVVYDHSTDMLGIGVGGVEQIQIDASGSVGLNSAPVLGNLVTLGGTATGLSGFNAFAGEVVIGQTVTDNFTYYKTESQTASASFNLNDLYHFRASQGTIGSGSSIDNQYGFYVNGDLSGATTNYGFYANTAGTNNYAFYSAGNSKVYFNTSDFKVANGGSDVLTISNGITSVDAGIVIGGGDTASRPSVDAGFIRFNTDNTEWEGWNGTSWGSLVGDNVFGTLQDVTNGGSHTTNNIEIGGTPGASLIELNSDGSAAFMNSGDGLSSYRNTNKTQGITLKSDSVANTIFNVISGANPKDLIFKELDTDDATTSTLGGWSSTGNFKVGSNFSSPTIELDSNGLGTFSNGVKITGGSDGGVTTGLYSQGGEGLYLANEGDYFLRKVDTEGVRIRATSSTPSSQNNGFILSVGGTFNHMVEASSDSNRNCALQISPNPSTGDMDFSSYGFSLVRASLNSGFTAGSDISVVSGFTAQARIGTFGSTNKNLGFEGQLNVVADVDNYNFYASGSAPNYFAGEVGIGTDSPVYPLQVSRDDSGTIAAEFNSTQDTTYIAVSGSGTSANGVRFGAFANNALIHTNGAERARFTSDGKLGLGTSVPDTNLHVASTTQDVLKLSTSAVNTKLYFESSGTTSQNYIKNTADTLSVITNGAEALIVDASGKVGIGTGNPDCPLHIQTTVIDQALHVQSGDANVRIKLSDSIASNGVFVVGKGDNLVFETNGNNERMRVADDGNVGVGTSTPRATLTVRGGNSVDFPVAGEPGSMQVSGGSSYGLQMGAVGSGKAYIQSGRSDGDATVYDLALQPQGGYVGIGAPSPKGNLHVRSDSTTRIYLEGNDGRHEFRASNGNLSIFTNINSDAAAGNTTIFYRDGATESMRINALGRLGIGTTSPDALLDIDDNLSTGIISQTPNAQVTDTNKAFRVRNGDTTNTFAVSYKGQVEAAGDILIDGGWSTGTGGATLSADGKLILRNDGVGATGGAILIYQDGTDTSDVNLRIEHGGNAFFAGDVGVGIDNPTEKFVVKVNDTSNAYGAIKLADGSTTSATVEVTRDFTDSDTILAFEANTTDGNCFNVNYAGGAYFKGDVGIGTSTPETQLHVKGSENNLLKLENSGNTFQSIGFYGTGDAIKGRIKTSTVNSNVYIEADPDNASVSSSINFSVDGTERAQITSTGSLGIGGTLPGSPNIELNADGSARFSKSIEIDSGNMVIGGTTPGAKLDVRGDVLIQADNKAGGALRVESDQTNPDNGSYYAQEIVSSLSGTSATTGDRGQGGLYIDVDSHTTGGDTSNEHRAYGIFVDLNSDGDSDVVTGVLADVAAAPTVGTTSTITGGHFVGRDDGGAGQVTNVYGVRGFAQASNSDSDADTLYAGWFRAQHQSTAGFTGAAYGVYSQVLIQGTGDVMGSSYGVRSRIENSTGVEQTNTSYLFHGGYAGVVPTTAWGVYIDGDIPNYFGGEILSDGNAAFTGNVAIGATAASSKISLRVRNDITGAATSDGVLSEGTVQSDVTNTAYYFRTVASTEAAAFTTSDLIHVNASQGTFGAGSTVTNQYGFRADNSLSGATNNYGFYSHLTANGSSDWNFYAAGTAPSYFGGNTEIGGTPGSGNIQLNTDGSGEFLGLNSVGSNDATTGTPAPALYSNNFGDGTAMVGIGQANSLPAIQGHGSGTGFHLHLNPSNGDVYVGADRAIRLNQEGHAQFDGTVIGSQNTITAGAWDLSTGNFWTCGSITVPNPTNATTGTSGLILLTSAPTGWGGNIKHPGGLVESITAFPAIVPFYVQSSTSILLGSSTQGIL